MFKSCVKEKRGKRVCGLCHSLGYHNYGYHDFSRSIPIAWFGCRDGQKFFSKNIGYNMDYKGTDTEYEAVIDTVKNTLLPMFEDIGFDKSFNDLEKQEVIDFVVKIINGYRDNLHIRISDDNPEGVKEFMNVNGLEVPEDGYEIIEGRKVKVTGKGKNKKYLEPPYDDEIPF